jgi:DNA-binding GntR family transcriptional regulator
MIGSMMTEPRLEPRPQRTPRSAKSSPDIVVDAILSGIRTGRLVPGQRLVEADLTHSLNISRGPVREALKRLAAEGVVTLSQNRGAYVRSLSRTEVIDLLKVVEVVTGLVARLATENLRSGAMRDQFVKVSEELMTFEGLGDSQAFIDKRRDFHEVLIVASSNAELQRIMPLMQIHLLRLQFQTRLTPEDRRKQFVEYRAIRDTVLEGRALRAERMMRIHIRRTRLSISRLPVDAFSLGER